MRTLHRLITSRALFGVLVVVCMACAAVFAVERWYAVPLRIPSRSMLPALHVGDRILVRRSFDSVAQLRRTIHRGDVLVFRAPQAGNPLVVKRVIGLPGDTIEAHDGVVAINDTQTLDEKWLPLAERTPNSSAARSVDIPRTELSDTQVYVLGDNRDSSIDSRTFGPVELSRIQGTVLFRFWPPSRVGTVNWL